MLTAAPSFSAAPSLSAAPSFPPPSAMIATPPTLRADPPGTLDFGRTAQNSCPQNERPVPRRAYRGWAMIQITQHTDGSAYARACEGPEVHAHIPGLDEPEVNAQMHGLDIREDQHKGASQTSQPQKESFSDRQLSSSVRSTDLFHGLSAVSASPAVRCQGESSRLCPFRAVVPLEPGFLIVGAAALIP
jgi:hypothetical protein